MPTVSTTYRPDLGQVAHEYLLEASQQGFIGLDIFPLFDVDRESGYYFKIPIESLLALPPTKRAPRANYGRSDWTYEAATYKCEEHGWEEAIDDVERQQNPGIMAEQIATVRALDIILRAQEKRIADAVFNTGNITATAAVTTEWDNASCTPLKDIYTAKAAMRAASGLEPNVVVISRKVFDAVMRSTEITGAFKYTNPIEIGGDEARRRILSQYFGVDRVLVGNAIKNTAKKGQNVSIGDIWDDEYCGLFRVSAGGRDLKEPCLGRTFLWTADSPQNAIVETYREEQTRSDIVRVRHNVDEEFVFVGAGYLLSNIHT